VVSSKQSVGLVSNRRRRAPAPAVALGRQRFRVPDRSGLAGLERYAQLQLPDGSTRLAGYTEASRGCRHRCRHCPVVPVYDGRFRVVQRDVVLADIDQQVDAGARHITFGDPDFWNGVTHAVRIVREMHRRHPDLTYDATIKVEHLLRDARHLAVLADTGCLLVTTAIESFDDEVLRRLWEQLLSRAVAPLTFLVAFPSGLERTRVPLELVEELHDAAFVARVDR
jgi:radical SAM superfamily enzyme YgiQ (UPF0313 family)